ncbi:flagellar hook-basal body complex subunit FliE [Desulfobulbus propionicus DSM 2032]|jgi:flagellar hook-basal body complex protein FliE|uniref:Flagellar hook-basal body complex protein FliE n=1 Tax=Desulfobulbus propionicus (strain ATCC 33891 / DSM 2032 / VKM B-1956 / 1pr3) TaxID=577650 RepID=A0A7U3YMZ1_DESPD|nr:flagellar hook-basal body complex protein FliE [Desulfobulbus propionicus]ADW18364.1 flagellar hook-basal body complex subunit FliE [Desulfobulbus propionicus DSM 2032]
MEPIQAVTPSLTPALPARSAVAQAETSFGDMLKTMVAQTNEQQQNADQALQQVHAGGEKNLHEAMIALEKADVSLRYMVQVRNKAISAYQEIMQMQV